MHEPVTAISRPRGEPDRLRSHRAMRLGLRIHSELAVALGAEHDGTGALIVDEHKRTTVPGLYAAGGVVRGLDQIVVAMGHGAVAATDIHNRRELPTEEEVDGAEAKSSSA